MTLKIRVCGEETLALSSSTRKLYINSYVQGDIGSMLDS